MKFTGLCTSVGQVHSNIVLIGDPKQLDAVTKSDWSTEMGFKTSWFEQLFNTTLYKRHETTGEFNSTYITQLVKNYRSHRAILRIPNQLFYENSLEAIVTPGNSNHNQFSPNSFSQIFRDCLKNSEIKLPGFFPHIFCNACYNKHVFSLSSLHRNHPATSGRTFIEKFSNHFQICPWILQKD